MRIRLPLGKERFSDIRENGDYYIDKTDFISKLLVEKTENDGVALQIPNEEVKLIFKTAIIRWFEESVQQMDRSDFFHAMWKGM